MKKILTEAITALEPDVSNRMLLRSSLFLLSILFTNLHDFQNPGKLFHGLKAIPFHLGNHLPLNLSSGHSL